VQAGARVEEACLMFLQVRVITLEGAAIGLALHTV
jgi:hypothetical protein